MVDLLPDWPQLTLFLGASLVLAVTPGPGVFFILATSALQGARAGFISALGIATGTLAHIGFAVFGLSVLITSSALAFQVVKYLGAVYLVYLGIRVLLGRDGATPHQPTGVMRATVRLFGRAMLINVLNPKVGLFFLAFLPQFVDPARGHPSIQFLSLGLMLTGIALVTDTLYALAAANFGTRWRPASHAHGWRRAFAGVTYIGLGIGSTLMDLPARASIRP
ncbi:MAG: RhtB family transporter [Acidiferrobacteraceae bacterium]|nr:RhtB family transporter [Acidiferrobacteraceae bacterium]MCP4828266.1 LysE family translocator [Pseudomonadota bacterium]HJP06276.1 LysE family translocator [Arenicellales bacterium]